jgi:chromosome segregation ATPase
MLVSIGAGYVAGYFVYKQYTVKTAEMERQSSLNYEKLQKELKGFYVTLENTIDENKIDRARFEAHIEKIKEDLKGWEKGYRESLAGLQAEIEGLKVDRLAYMVEKLQEDMQSFKMTIQDMDMRMDDIRGVDLGKIAVGNDDNKN